MKTANYIFTVKWTKIYDIDPYNSLTQNFKERKIKCKIRTSDYYSK